MKTISLILLLTFIPVFKNFGYTLIFESEKVFIKTDTASFYEAIGNGYPAYKVTQIKREISRRHSITKTDEIQMDKMSLQFINDSNEQDSIYISFRNEIFNLIDSRKAKVYYKSNLREITTWYTKQKGPNEKGEIRKIYRDKKNYRHIITKVHRICIGLKIKPRKEK